MAKRRPYASKHYQRRVPPQKSGGFCGLIVLLTLMTGAVSIVWAAVEAVI